MLARIKHLYKDNTIAVAIVITISIVYLSLVKVSGLKPIVSIKHLDKYEHALAYFGLMLSWLFVFEKFNKKRIFRFLIVLAVFLFGMLMELLQQMLTTSRQADVYDVFANTSGIIIAYLVYEKLVFKKFKVFLSQS